MFIVSTAAASSKNQASPVGCSKWPHSPFREVSPLTVFVSNPVMDMAEFFCISVSIVSNRSVDVAG